MRYFLLASHLELTNAMFSAAKFLAGDIEAEVISAFLHGSSDIEELLKEKVAKLDAEMADDDELIVCTDILGGSVNNECMKKLLTRPNTHIITNINLPVLLQVLLMQDEETTSAIRDILSQREAMPIYVNEMMLAQVEADEDF